MRGTPFRIQIDFAGNETRLTRVDGRVDVPPLGIVDDTLELGSPGAHETRPRNVRDAKLSFKAGGMRRRLTVFLSELCCSVREVTVRPLEVLTKQMRVQA